MNQTGDRSDQKEKLHARNKHRQRYDFNELVNSCPELLPYLSKNSYGDTSVDFSNSDAVKLLNRALLKHFYSIELWDIPEGYLCPPIPGRADYIHYLADLLGEKKGKIASGKSVRILDVGVGANCIYPLLGYKEYRWSFVGSDTDQLAIRSAKNIVDANGLSKAISIRRQSSTDHVFEGLIHHGEKFDATMCNPPFHGSLQQSNEGTARKWKNLGKASPAQELNFGGKESELWCEGGEVQFVTNMIKESTMFAASVGWFTTLISKKESLALFYNKLKEVKAKDVRTIDISQGHKVSRILAWTFI